MTLTINNATNGTFTAETTVDTLNTDGVSSADETTWQNSEWSQQWGYFNSQPELQSAILLKATLTLGDGYSCDIPTSTILNNITGIGDESFTDILLNMETTAMIAGDSYAEIIRLDNIIVNIKPLDPASIKIIFNDKGIIKRYEQTSKLGKNSIKKFKPEEILHFSHRRLADQIHGISVIKALEEVIKAENESFLDMKQIMHNQAKPLILWKLKTDNTATIAAFVTKINNARKLGNDMFIPDDDNAVSHELVEVSPSALIFEYRNDIKNKFYRTVGLPELFVSSQGATESSGKIGYATYELQMKAQKRKIEQTIKKQLGLTIVLNPTPSLMPNLQQDQAKDGTNAFQPSDMMAGVGR